MPFIRHMRQTSEEEKIKVKEKLFSPFKCRAEPQPLVSVANRRVSIRNAATKQLTIVGTQFGFSMLFIFLYFIVWIAFWAATNRSAGAYYMKILEKLHAVQLPRALSDITMPVGMRKLHLRVYILYMYVYVYMCGCFSVMQPHRV